MSGKNNILSFKEKLFIIIYEEAENKDKQEYGKQVNKDIQEERSC